MTDVQTTADTHRPNDVPPPTDANPTAVPRVDTRRLADALLLIYADALDDTESVRIAMENRVRSLRDVKGMDGTPEEARLAALVDSLRTLEHGAELELKRAVRKHPLGPWIKSTIGVGEKQGARMLAAIGWPGDRAMVSQLWSYCGYSVINPGPIASDAHTACAGDATGPDPHTAATHRPRVGSGGTTAQIGYGTHDVRGGDTPGHETYGTQPPRAGGVAPTRKRGERSNWNGIARTRVYLVAESCMKKRDSPYRAVYDNGRTKYAESVHTVECKRCGPSGNPAAVGSPLNDGHKHARALRLVAKAILRDLWIEAKRIDADGTPDV